jgi:hypothetical protein
MLLMMVHSPSNVDYLLVKKFLLLFLLLYFHILSKSVVYVHHEQVLHYILSLNSYGHFTFLCRHGELRVDITSKRKHMDTLEQLQIQKYHHKRRLIPEQNPHEYNPLSQVLYSTQAHLGNKRSWSLPNN